MAAHPPGTKGWQQFLLPIHSHSNLCITSHNLYRTLDLSSNVQTSTRERRRKFILNLNKTTEKTEYEHKRTRKNVSICILRIYKQASKVMLKILQGRLQQYMNCEHPDVRPGFRKGRRTRDQIANNCLVIEKSKGIPEKHPPLLH